MPPIPLETPEKTFTKRVKPPYDAYMLDPDTEWKAVAAASAVGNFPEWAYQYYEHHDPTRLQGAKNHGQYRERLCQQCPELRTVFEIALAGKHRFLKKKPDRTVIGSTDAFEMGPRLILQDGRYYNEVLERAYNFLRQLLDL